MTYESHVQHALALPCILLLKLSRTNSDLHQFIGREICEGLIEYLLGQYGIWSCEFDQYTRLDAEKIVKNCIRKKIVEFQDSQKLMALMVASNNVHNRILFRVQNLLEPLPLEPISQKVDELELITRYTTAAINPLLENLMKHVMFRWTSVANDECKSSEMSLLLARPDSTISIMIGTEIGQTVGYGEVKPASQALNHKMVGKDLVRLAFLAKNAINTYRSKFVPSFLVVGVLNYSSSLHK